MACQLDTLRSCLKPSILRKVLKELPVDLDDTYERILLRIPVEHRADAQTVFNLLAFSNRAISLGEAAEAVAINLELDIFDPDDRLREPSSVLEICSSLVTLTPFAPQKSPWNTNVQMSALDSNKELRFAHFSVKEYLMSNRQSHKSSQIFSLQVDNAQKQLSKLCLVYLLSICEEMDYPPESMARLPYLEYAAHYWPQHVQHVLELGNEPSLGRLLSLFLLGECGSKLQNALRVHNPDNVFTPPSVGTDLLALYFASLLGFVEICRKLVATNVSLDAEGGHYGNALQAASHEGNEDVVRLLLKAGADVNAQGGLFGNALAAASHGGHDGVVTLLLQAGAETNGQGGHYGSALQAASFGHHEGVVRLKFQPNTQGGVLANVLQSASDGGHEKIVKLLLQAGADVNAQGPFGNALQVAAHEGHEEIMRLLLEAGAELNAQEGMFGNALLAASERGDEQVVRLLLQSGADVNAQGGCFGNALQAASQGGHEQVVRLLLQAGAYANAQGGYFGNALQGALQGGHDEVVTLLLQEGAHVNAREGHDGNALQVAGGGDDGNSYEDILRLLSELGYSPMLSPTEASPFNLCPGGGAV